MKNENETNLPEVDVTSEDAAEYSRFTSLRGKLLKLGFYVLLALMSCGTLFIALYTFIGRGLIG